MKVLGQAWRYATGILALRREDVILASFPKSGSTWLRFLLCNLVMAEKTEPRDGAKGGAAAKVDFSLLNATMPELGRSDLSLPWPATSLPRLVKTHRPHTPLFRRQRSILMLRDPRDVMVSFYFFEQGKKRPRFRGSFSELLQHPRFGLEAWFRHSASWWGRAGTLLRYEDLKRDTRGELEKVLAFLGAEVPPEQVARAVERSRFEVVRKLEEAPGKAHDDRFKTGFRFARQGKSGGWREHFSHQDLDLLAEVQRRYPADLIPRLGETP